MKKPNFALLISTLFISSHLAQTNPYESIGKKSSSMLTLSNGKYVEHFNNDSVRQVGSAMVNIYTEQIVAFVDQKDEGKKHHSQTNSRFLSIDPLARQFPELSPYQYASNSPIAGIDLDGLELIFYSTKPNTQPTVMDEATIRVNAYTYGLKTGSIDIKYKFSDVGVTESFIQHNGEWLRLPKGFDANNLPKDENFYEGLQNFKEFNEAYKEKVNEVVQGLEIGANVAKMLSVGLAKGAGLFGSGGIHTPSKTIKTFKDQGRIDIENPSPGKGSGNIHYQKGSDKYYFNSKDKSFYKSFKNGEFSGPVSESINKKLTGNKDIQVAIDKGLKYLGEKPSFKQ